MAFFEKKDTSETFKRLYFEYYAVLCRSVYRFVKDEEATKDIVQDVFIKYWKRLGEMQVLESEIAYLRKSCINAALNYLKEKERRDQRESHFAKEIDDSGDRSERPDMKYSLNETSRNIESAIDQLPPACRQAFLLSRYEEKSYKEIAEILHISVNTVEKHIGKALKKLREVLK
jgi:RNA polymerase sigma-70 factor (ECF subfamily)